jgi:DNA-binding response OmpR family regulator
MSASLNILVVEDNDDLRETTLMVLRDEGHNVTGISCAEDLPELGTRFDLMLLDLNLPGEDGLSLAERVRRIEPQVGLIMLTARRLPEDRRRGYESGADIYMPKPVSFDELCAAVQSLGRRVKVQKLGAPRMRVHQQRLLLVGLNDQILTLSARECIALTAFCRAPDQRLELWQLIELLQTQDAGDPKAALELHVVRLRKKLQEAGYIGPSLLAIRGWGYQLCCELELE